jgi:hypothetical protein
MVKFSRLIANNECSLEKSGISEILNIQGFQFLLWWNIHDRLFYLLRNYVFLILPYGTGNKPPGSRSNRMKNFRSLKNFLLSVLT